MQLHWQAWRGQGSRRAERRAQSPHGLCPWSSTAPRKGFKHKRQLPRLSSRKTVMATVKVDGGHDGAIWTPEESRGSLHQGTPGKATGSGYHGVTSQRLPQPPSHPAKPRGALTLRGANSQRPQALEYRCPSPGQVETLQEGHRQSPGIRGLPVAIVTQLTASAVTHNVMQRAAVKEAEEKPSADTGL